MNVWSKRRRVRKHRLWRSEAFVLVEFSKVLATYARGGALGAEAAGEVLAAAEQLPGGQPAARARWRWLRNSVFREPPIARIAEAETS